LGTRARNRNKRGFLFYFFCYQFLSSPISLGGYVLEGLHTRKKW
jgi:hypothetical protein